MTTQCCFYPTYVARHVLLGDSAVAAVLLLLDALAAIDPGLTEDELSNLKTKIASDFSRLGVKDADKFVDSVVEKYKTVNEDGIVSFSGFVWTSDDGS